MAAPKEGERRAYPRESSKVRGSILKEPSLGSNAVSSEHNQDLSLSCERFPL